MEARPRGYEDKVMDSSLLPASSQDDGQTLDQDGLRSFYSESRITQSRSDTGLALRMATTLGQRVGYRQQTVNHGEFVFEADVRAGQGESGLGSGFLGLPATASGQRITLRNLGFPVTPSVFLDSAVGDIGSEVTDALSRTYRVSLGNSVVRGASARISANGLDVRAGLGQRGLLTGGPVAGFQRSRGSLAWAGFTTRFGERAFAGVQVNHASDLPDVLFNGTVAGNAIAVTSVAGSAGTTLTLGPGSDLRGRIIGLQSTTTDSQGSTSATGLAAEGTWRIGSQRHEFGAYFAQPGLRFGDANVLLGDLGAYWRVDTSGPRLSWGAGLDGDQQKSRAAIPGIARITATGNGTWRLGRNDAVGANASVSHSTFDAGTLSTPGTQGTRNLSASAFWQTRILDWGRTTFRLAARRNVLLAANIAPASGEELLWEQDWPLGSFENQRPELGTTLGVARDRSSNASSTQPTAGVQFRVWPDADWSVSGALRYTARDSNVALTRGWAGSVNTDLLLGGGWRIGASLVLNQVVLTVPQTLFTLPSVTRTNDAYASVFLRWDATRGSTASGVGAVTGLAGSGTMEGVVFLDANRDGEQQVGEAGVPDVEVLLDGRYRVRTDREGRFVFALVTTGKHQLTVTPETVPLPWGQRGDEPVSVDVPLRGVASTRIPVVRVGE